MRILNINVRSFCTANNARLGHLLHHYLMHAAERGAAVWALFVVAVAVVIFLFIGGCLLLRRAR